MAKRSPGLERRPNDYYRTWDFNAVRPLLPFLPTACRFVEPCAGDGVLVDHLTNAGHRCVLKSDIVPQRSDIRRLSVFSVRWSDPQGGMFITNPPWSREILHPIIRHLSTQAPTWLLFDADWLFTRQSTPLLPLLRKVVAIGRVRWIEGTATDGKDNSAWFLFDGTRPPTTPTFHGRLA
jgi:hypothetical protein